MNELSRDTLKLLQSVLDETWSSLRPEEQARTSKTQIGARILELAASGERDPVRLRKKTMAEVVATSPALKNIDSRWRGGQRSL